MRLREDLATGRKARVTLARHRAVSAAPSAASGSETQIHALRSAIRKNRGGARHTAACRPVVVSRTCRIEDVLMAQAGLRHGPWLANATTPRVLPAQGPLTRSARRGAIPLESGRCRCPSERPRATRCSSTIPACGRNAWFARDGWSAERRSCPSHGVPHLDVNRHRRLDRTCRDQVIDSYRPGGPGLTASGASCSTVPSRRGIFSRRPSRRSGRAHHAVVRSPAAGSAPAPAQRAPYRPLTERGTLHAEPSSPQGTIMSPL